MQDFDSEPCVQRRQPDLYNFRGHWKGGRHKDPLFFDSLNYFYLINKIHKQLKLDKSNFDQILLAGYNDYKVMIR